MVDQSIAGKGIFAGFYDKEDLNNHIATNAGRGMGPFSSLSSSHQCPAT
jgi:hypothetical protein